MTDPRWTEQEHTGPVIRDKRRIDPVTGEIREPRRNAAPESSAGPVADAPAPTDVGSDVADLEKALEDACHRSNPRPCTRDDMAKLYELSL